MGGHGALTCSLDQMHSWGHRLGGTMWLWWQDCGLLDSVRLGRDLASTAYWLCDLGKMCSVTDSLQKLAARIK